MDNNYTIAKEVLFNSRYTRPDYYLDYIKRDENITFYGLSLESMEINVTQLKDDCNKTLDK